MKWDKPTGSIQMTADGCYAIQQANSHDWVAYAMPKFGPAEELGVRSSDGAARDCCEDHEREMIALRKAG